MGQIIPKPPLEIGLGARILSPDPLCFLPPRASHRRPPAEVPHTIHPAEGVRLLWAARGDVATPGSPALPCYGRLNAMGSEAPICIWHMARGIGLGCGAATWPLPLKVGVYGSGFGT